MKIQAIAKQVDRTETKVVKVVGAKTKDVRNIAMAAPVVPPQFDAAGKVSP